MKPGVIGLYVIPVIILILLYFSSLGNGRTEGFNSFGETNDRGTFTMYYADWCPHCQQVKPMFNELMKKGYISVNDKRVQVKMVEEKQMKKGVDPDVKGYPSFLYSDPAGKVVEYNGPRNSAGFLEFLKTQILA